ncbi:hypothetical protein FHQ18_12255 [Deferribacter autotrophicus]|uniref:Uncharacterized protein n=1 Tax=Deferribacter autotrophicus TaxID=500465 RepID=A0A5A8EZ05_9BACT|nr:hypothetical protein [Deferribacter autotrophicus]KAA0256891.1 hypothetical protein FHQ18_12255 [Deferribacter autotrophicus]
MSDIIEGSSSEIINIYKKRKENNKYEILSEGNNYAFIGEKGFMSYQIIHITPPVGLIDYIDAMVLDLK